jgi:hypothetical protein
MKMRDGEKGIVVEWGGGKGERVRGPASKPAGCIGIYSTVQLHVPMVSRRQDREMTFLLTNSVGLFSLSYPALRWRSRWLFAVRYPFLRCPDSRILSHQTVFPFCNHHGRRS